MAIGDVEFKSESGKTHVLNFGTNSLCRIEEAANKTYGDALAELRGDHPSVIIARAFVFGSLVNREGLTLDRAGDVLDDIGGPAAILAAFKAVGQKAV